MPTRSWARTASRVPEPVDWSALIGAAAVEPHAAGIYEWRIGDRALYVGKASTLRSRLREYVNNVRKIAAGVPYRRAQPDGFRAVHHELARAAMSAEPITVAVLETCDRGQLLDRERYWIARRRQEADAGGAILLNAERRPWRVPPELRSRQS